MIQYLFLIIYVMKQGKVIEKGNHSELMQLNGEYAKSWLIQTRQASGIV